MATYSSLIVANKLLEFARNDQQTLTPMQLIKLTYLSHGWMLAINGRPLLDEAIEAWQYGPVIPELYQAVRAFKSQPVTSIPVLPGVLQMSPDDESLIKEVYDVYGKYDGLVLSALTHQPNTPWDIVWRSNGRSATISNDLIENHFRSLASETDVAEAS